MNAFHYITLTLENESGQESVHPYQYESFEDMVQEFLLDHPGDRPAIVDSDDLPGNFPIEGGLLWECRKYMKYLDDKDFGSIADSFGDFVVGFYRTGRTANLEELKRLFNDSEDGFETFQQFADKKAIDELRLSSFVIAYFDFKAFAEDIRPDYLVFQECEHLFILDTWYLHE